LPVGRHNRGSRNQQYRKPAVQCRSHQPVKATPSAIAIP
jgi:hypothetical protein